MKGRARTPHEIQCCILRILEDRGALTIYNILHFAETSYLCARHHLNQLIKIKLVGQDQENKHYYLTQKGKEYAAIIERLTREMEIKI